VTSAFGTFEGTVRYNGTPINTGVLIIATTATITAIPPDIDDALRTSGTPYYGTVSHANGSFSLQVRGGTAYSYNIYAWYATSATRQPQMQPRTGKTVAAGGKTTVEFTWP
jgi:nitrate reductase alpha subunit